MPHGGTHAPVSNKQVKVELSDKEKCEGRGGIWDEATKTCNLSTAPKQGTEQQQAATTKREQFQREQQQLAQRESEAKAREEAAKTQAEAQLDVPITSGDLITGDFQRPQSQEPIADQGTKIDFLSDGTVDFTKNGQTINLTREEYGVAILGEAGRITEAGQAAKDLQNAPSLESQRQVGQVGQFEQLGVSPTGFDIESIGGAAATGIIPGLIRGVSSGIGLGILGAKAGGAVGALGGPAGIAVVGALGFASGIAGSILSEMRGQRTDNTNAQQRVLDEGKQILNDWVTFAEANPALKSQALAGFNQQLQQIDQAYRQMKLDTSRDLAAFENAIPNLAEFEAFYSGSGERDVLATEMRIALGGQEASEFKYIELSDRRG